jgi:hypothetical protein
MTSPKNAPSKLSRRKFLTGSSATVAGAAVATSGISLLSERAEAFFNMTFWKKRTKTNSSLRLNSSNSAYLSFTPRANGNSKIYSMSLWIKRASTGLQTIVSTGGGPNYGHFRFSNATGFPSYYSADSLVLEHKCGCDNAKTTNTFTNTSAWYHIFLSVDVTQASPSDTVQMYVNGINQSPTSTALPTNIDSYFNVLNNEINIGRLYNGATNHLNAYVYDVYWLDGLAIQNSSLSLSSFGKTIGGVWMPQSYSGTCGTNGFHLTFSNPSNLGADSSGNGNHLTIVNAAPSDLSLSSPTVETLRS